ncbi:MAG TPA: DNA polymerase III subunit delta' [Acidobacteriota bacterium]|nr:DNA polymerase III subunit delta' [Acidobacteriota bacterium]
MKFTDFAGNERIVEHFKKALERKQLGHAYLFSGPAGTGKSTLARLICKTLLCKKPGPNGPDNECASCHKFDSGNHSDFHYFEPDGLYFKIDLVRQIIHQASLRPVESQWKTFVLEGADLMRDEAANALLKVLEEPPGQAILFLIAQSSEALLPTIRSRCQNFAFQPLQNREIERVLASSGEFDKKEAQERARYSQGSLGRARSLDPDQYVQVRDKVLAALEAALAPKSYHILFDAIRAITVERTEMPERFLILEELIRDTLLLQTSPQAQLIHDDARTRIAELSRKIDAGNLRQLYDRLLEAREAVLKVNANIGLALQSVLLPARVNSAPAQPKS